MSGNVVQSALRSLLGEQQTRSVLLIGSLPEVDWPSALAADSTPEFVALPPERAHTLPQYGLQDLVAIGNTLEVLPRRDAEIMLAGLRDLYARRVLLRLAANAIWRHQDVMAFGFTRLAQLTSDGNAVTYYGFDVGTYKTTPDWLNAKYWANPELFGRYRW